MASMILGNLGSSMLGPLGGMIGSYIGGMIDNYLFAPDQEGPRLDDLSVQRPDPGGAIPLIYGADRVTGQLMSTTELIETVHKERVGKGGGPKIVTYTYAINCNILLCEGPILGVGRIWADGNMLRQPRVEMEISTKDNPMKIGGLPYPDWFLDHYYKPELIPTSLDYNSNGRADGQFYRMIGRGERMEVYGPAGEVPEDQKVYWRDSVTGYYIPLGNEYQGYTNEIEENEEKTNVSSILASTNANWTSSLDTLFAGDESIDTRNISGSPVTISLQGVIAHLTVYSNGGVGAGVEDALRSNFDTGVKYSRAQLAGEEDLPFNQGQARAEFKIRVSPNGSGVGAWATSGTVQVNLYFHAQADQTLLDGDFVGATVGSYTSVIFEVPDHLNGKWIEFKFNTDIPEGTRFITAGFKWAILMPIWVNYTLKLDMKMQIHAVARQESADKNFLNYWNIYDLFNDFSPGAFLSYEGCDDLVLYHGDYDQLPTPFTIHGDDISPEPAYRGRAYISLDNFQLEDFGNRIPTLTFETLRCDSDFVPDVIDDFMSRSGIEEEYYDTSQIQQRHPDNHVLGYAVSRKTNYRAALEVILEAFRIDAAEIGYKLYFRPLGREVDYTIDYNDLAADSSSTTETDNLIKVEMRDPIDLPATLTVKYKDPERLYQPNTKDYARRQAPGNGTDLVELSVVGANHKMKRYARDRIQQLWQDRVVASFSVSDKHAFVHPTDLIEIRGEDRSTLGLKVGKVIRGDNGVYEVEATLRDMTLLAVPEGYSDTIEVDDYYPRPTHLLSTVAATFFFPMDIPPLRESDLAFGFYYGLASDSDGWPGGYLTRSMDAGGNYDVIGTSSTRAIAGFVIEWELDDKPFEFIDRTGWITVQLVNQTDALQSITFDEFANGGNVCVIGREILQFMVAEDLGNGLWKISMLSRGMRGTNDPEIAFRFFGQNFVMVDPNTTYDREDRMSLRDVGLLYRSFAKGNNPENGLLDTFENKGLRHKPLSPYAVGSSHERGVGRTITWIRRDRVYTSWVGGADLGMSEQGLQFELDIYSGSTFLRTVTVDAATEYLYTEGQMEHDGFIDPPSADISVVIYQMSATFGRGYGRKANV